MLVIRTAQWEAMRRARTDEFHRKIARMVQADRPEWRRGQLDDSIEIASWMRQRAASYGVFLAEDILRFVRFVIRYGRDYETRADMAWANRILNDLSLMGPQKLDELERRSR